MKGPRARLILNPAAGDDQAAALAVPLTERLTPAFGALEVAFTSGQGDGEVAARRAVEDGCDVLFVGGGDGTLNEVLNGVAAVPGALSSVTFGVIPLGTGNDFAQALGLLPEADEAVATLLQRRVVRVDVGQVNGRSFINISGGGFIAEVSEAVTPQMKTIAGRLAYLLGGAQTLLEFEPVDMTFSGSADGQSFTARIYAFAACNSRLIGGGKLIAPHALIDDGLLDFCVIESMPALEFVALLRRVADGEHVDDPRVRYIRAAGAVLEFGREILVNTDGEILKARACRYEVLPKAAAFFAGEPAFAGSSDPGDPPESVSNDA